MTIRGFQVDVAHPQPRRHRDVQYGQLIGRGRTGGPAIVEKIDGFLILHPAVVEIRVPVEQPFAQAGFGLPAQRLGPRLVERLLHLGAKLQGIRVFLVLELDAFVEIDVAVLRERRVIVVVFRVVVPVDDRRIETGRPRRAVEGILSVVPPRGVAIGIDREHPALRKGLVVGQPEISVIIAVFGLIEKIAGHGIRHSLPERLREFAAVRVVIGQGIVSGKRQAAKIVAAQRFDAQAEGGIVGELPGLRVVAGRRTVEPLATVQLLRSVVVVLFVLPAGIAEGRFKGKEDLFPVGILELEIDLYVVGRREGLVFGPGKNIAAGGVEGRPFRPAA